MLGTNYTFGRYLQMALTVLMLFFLTLSVPFISSISLAIILLLGTFAKGLLTNKVAEKNIGFLSTAILTLFSILFWTISSSYDFLGGLSLINFLVNLINFPLAYFIGVSINYRILPYWPFNVIILALSLVWGGVFFSYLNVVFAGVLNLNTDEFLISDRQVPNIWSIVTGNAGFVNGPTMDLFNIMGLVLFPILIWLIILIFTKKSKTLVNIIITICLFLAFSMSLYSALALQGRTPIVALLVSSIITIFLGIVKSRNRYRLAYLFCLSLAGIIFLLRINEIINPFLEFLFKNELLTRFESNGFETARYDLWKAVLEGMFEYPSGGRQIYLFGESYAHNLWLDVAYDTGLIPIILLVIFHAFHIKPFVKVLSSNLPPIIQIFLVTLLVGFAVSFTGTPVIQASPIFFIMSCFFLGLINRLSAEVDML